MIKAENIGSSFDEFLIEEALLDDATAAAIKRVISWQVDQEMKAQGTDQIGNSQYEYIPVE